MGKIIRDGFHFMEYVNSGLIRKIDDIPELKNKLIAISELKTKLEISEYACLLAAHILEISGTERSSEIEDCFTIIGKWQNKEVKFQEALEVAGVMNRLARNEKNVIKKKVFRAMAQVAAVPHVRWHGLVASEYAVVIINLLYPGNLDKVEQERLLQIEMMENI